MQSLNQQTTTETTALLLNSNNIASTLSLRRNLAEQGLNEESTIIDIESDDDIAPIGRRIKRYSKMQTGAAVGGLALFLTAITFYFIRAISTGLENVKQVKNHADWLHFAEAVSALVFFMGYAGLCYRLIFKANQENIESVIAGRGQPKATLRAQKRLANESQNERSTFIYRSELKHEESLGKGQGKYHLSARKIVNIDFEFYLGVIRQHLSFLDIMNVADLQDEKHKKQIMGNYLIACLLFTKLQFIAFRFDAFAMDANKDPEIRGNVKYNELLMQELKNINNQPNDIANVEQMMQGKTQKFTAHDTGLFKEADDIVQFYKDKDLKVKRKLNEQGLFHKPSAYRNRFASSSEVTINHKLIIKYAKEYNTGSEYKFTI